MRFDRASRPWSRRPASGPPVLSETRWLDRRQVLRSLGFGGVLLGGASLFGCRTSRAVEEDPTTDYEASARWVPSWEPVGGSRLYPPPRNRAHAVRRSLTSEDRAATHNNFYEFLPGGAGPVHRHAKGFEPRPWRIAIDGEVEAPRTIDVDEIARIAPLEERVYHFRCVEAWSMVVPWTGIPLADFVAWCKPLPSAAFVRFVSFGERDLTPEQARHAPSGFSTARHYPWPFYEALRMDEAVHPLSLLVTGIYGHGLPMQHGAPVRVEFTSSRPATFWNDLHPDEYGFLSNVEPTVPHPRWSQATEIDIETGDRIPTLPYNGYAAEVARLYS